MNPEPVTLSPEHSRYLRALSQALGVEVSELVQCMMFQIQPSNHIEHFLDDWELSDSERASWKQVQDINEAQANPWDWQEFSELIEL